MDMQSFMKNAKKMQEEIHRIQEELSRETVEASSGGGMVTVRASGKQEIISVRIDKEIVSSGDHGMLEDLVLAAVNDALRKSQELVQQRLGTLAGGLKIPGL